MERDAAFLDCKNQCCENFYTTQSNILIQAIHAKLSRAFFTELEKKKKTKHTIRMDTQKTLNDQSNPEKEKHTWSNKGL